MLSLGEIADLIGAECHGDCSITVNSVADIQKAGPGQLSFVTNVSYAKYLQSSKASGVITSPEISSEAALSTKHVNLLLMKDPYLGYARAAQLFDTTPTQSSGIHATAVIAEDVQIADSASVAAQVFIDTGCTIGENVTIGPGCYLGKNVTIGDDSRLWSGVNIYHDVKIGNKALFHSGCIIGSDGFGFVPNKKGELALKATIGADKIIAAL